MIPTRKPAGFTSGCSCRDKDAHIVDPVQGTLHLLDNTVRGAGGGALLMIWLDDGAAAVAAGTAVAMMYTAVNNRKAPHALAHSFTPVN